MTHIVSHIETKLESINGINYQKRSVNIKDNEYANAIISSEVALLWSTENDEQIFNIGIELLKIVKIREMNKPQNSLLFKTFNELANEILKPVPIISKYDLYQRKTKGTDAV